MHTPPHPASIIREDIIPHLGITITQAAEELGVTRVTLSRLLNEKSGISPEMALRLEYWLEDISGTTAAYWLSLQAHYDLWKARQNYNKIKRSITKAVPTEYDSKTTSLF